MRYDPAFEQGCVLATLLGEAHALFTPMRDPDAHYWAYVWECRYLYPSCGGLRWQGPEDSYTMRALRALERRGCVLWRHVKDFLITNVTLTPLGICTAGELVGYSNDQHQLFMAILLSHAPAGEWVSETALAHNQDYRSVERFALQALGCGYVESNCDKRGRVYYRLTPGGMANYQKPRIALQPQPDPVFLRLYESSLERTLIRLHNDPLPTTYTPPSPLSG